jgi:hypothetical protein
MDLRNVCAHAPASSMAKLRSVTVAVTVAIAAPIEAVVDPHLNHLNVAVPLKEDMANQGRGDHFWIF